MFPMLNVAVKAARRAAGVIQRAAVNLDTILIEKKASHDFVTEVDKTAEAMIMDIILEAYPTHAILAEESGQHTGTTPEYQWYIDPLDGTTNFIHGYPQYAVSIALMHQQKIQHAVVYDLARNNLFTATRGDGAYVNDRRIRVSKRTRLENCLLSTGIPMFNERIIEQYLKILRDLISQHISTRHEGSAALDLCHVACGKIDGFFEFNLKPWDVAAGALIVQEAGGIVTDLQGENTWLDSGNILAANPKLMAQLLRLITKHYDGNSVSSHL